MKPKADPVSVDRRQDVLFTNSSPKLLDFIDSKDPLFRMADKHGLGDVRHALLLDKGIYLGSESSFYRILNGCKQHKKSVPTTLKNTGYLKLISQLTKANILIIND